MSESPLRHTNATDLLVPLIVVGAVVYVLLRFSYDSLPALQYYAALPIGALAIVELLVARRVRGAIRHDPEAKPMTAIAIARSVALGKATALVGAAVVGATLGLFGRVLPEAGTVSAAAHDAQVGAVVFGVSVVLVVAGLLLERAGTDPGGGRQPHGSR